MVKAGIYQIRALHNNEVYVGSSTNLEKREKDHFRFLKYGTHDNPKLQASYNKYGRDNFVFEVLMFCEPENCLELEQEHFDRLMPHFNIVMVAGKPPSRKGKTQTFTNAQKENMKQAAILRGKIQRQKTYEDNLHLYNAIKESGLSVRAYCTIHNMTPNRTYINKGYREYLNETQSPAEKFKKVAD